MKQVMIHLDDATAAELERVAPGSSRKRSEFLRGVIARALHETLEVRTRKAYEKFPDQAPPVERESWAAEEEAVHPASKTSPARIARKKARR